MTKVVNAESHSLQQIWLSNRSGRNTGLKLVNFLQNLEIFQGLSLYKIVTTEIGNLKLCTHWVPKMLSGWCLLYPFSHQKICYVNQKICFLKSLMLLGMRLEPCTTNQRTIEQTKQQIHTRSPSKPKKYKQSLTNRKTKAKIFRDKKRYASC